MSRDRIDELLEEAIVTGIVPNEATPEERAELLGLLGSAAFMRAANSEIDVEARATMPSARARFERHMAARRPAAPRARSRVRPGVFTGLFNAHRFLTPIATAAAIGVIAAGALFLSQAAFTDTETANAQVLEPGDYVQVQGVVTGATSEGDARRVSLTSEVGEFQVDVSGDTAIVADQAAVTPGALKAGDTILVGGVVAKDRKIVARTVAVHEAYAGPPPQPAKLREAKKGGPAFEGQIVVLSFSPDGLRGRVVIKDAQGRHFIVPVDRSAAEALLRNSATAPGTPVQVAPRPGPKHGEFDIETGGKPPQEKPGFTSLKGRIIGREANVLQVEGPEGPVAVIIRPDTTILPGESGLIVDAVRQGKRSLVGYGVAVAGGLDRATGRMIADVIVIGPPPANR